MYLTLKHNSGGNHGHQLKDLFGAITIAKVFDFTYVHTPYPYLDWFGLGEGEIQISELPDMEKVGVKPTKVWGGFSYKEAEKIFTSIKGERLVVLEKAQRIHPFQTIRWHEEGLTKRDVFGEIVRETNAKFVKKHGGKKLKKVAMHISRGRDFGRGTFLKRHTMPHYMFPISYYERIIEQLGDREIHIYTERLNSEEVVEAFKDRAVLHIGDNRDQKNYEQIYDIFYNFVMSDIFVGCSSSFSAVVAYFRERMIYHPHDHLRNLPSPQYIPTDTKGNFNTENL